MGNSFVKILPAPTVVPLGTGSVSFRGLSAEDTATLFSMFKDSALAFFATLDKEGTNWGQLVLAAPQMTNCIVAMGAGIDLNDEAEMQALRSLPVGDLATCLGAIYTLSVVDEKKFLAQIQALLSKLRSANSNAKSLVSPSQTPSAMPSQAGLTTSSELGTPSAT